MKRILFLFTALLVLVACKNGNTEEPAISENAETPAIETEALASKYQYFGEEFSNENVLTDVEMKEKFKSLGVNDTVYATFTATVNEVCKKKGCWMKLDIDGEETMVRFKDYGFFMPKDIDGKSVTLNGKAYVEEMSVKDQRHYAEDGGKSEEEIAAITEPKLTLAFEADGVLIPVAEKQ